MTGKKLKPLKSISKLTSSLMDSNFYTNSSILYLTMPTVFTIYPEE